MTCVVLHLIIGCLALAASAVGREFCPHPRHQRMVTFGLLLFEATVTAKVIG